MPASCNELFGSPATVGGPYVAWSAGSSASVTASFVALSVASAVVVARS
jgi:hypothetical protein